MVAYESQTRYNRMQSKRRSAAEHLSDSAKRRIAQGVLKSTIRWNAFLNHVMGIDNLQHRIEMVARKYGWGGISIPDLMRFVHRPEEQAATALLAMKMAKTIVLVERSGQDRLITPEHIDSQHPRILKDLFQGSDLTTDHLNGKA